ncbi:GATA zinc finger domain-containing protein 3-like isoform X2 [Danaus plexippus]|uniref:GATA zinc finger domain-containing protein 3-like isoform X2 n=1 Tax=Danaus plexippus TaxID=13037 RepID=UPI002AB25A0C|nr:GATA zinc finger domain-containing protein 3-like isoform X2 [Danaus plexippus]
MTISIIVALTAIINAFLHITNASAQNEYASRNRQNQAESDSVYMNNYNRNHQIQLSNFANGNYKHNVINVDQTSNGFSVSSYEADHNIRQTSTNYNVHLNNPARTTNEPQSRGSIDRQQILREILEKAKIGTGNNNNNQIYVNGERINLYPNRADNHATDEAVVSGRSSVGPTQFVIVMAVVLKIKIL